MNHTDEMTAYLGALVDEMAKTDISHAVISPGSRSTPLAMLLEENENICTYLQVDERSAAFFALGIAKATQKPVALLCTSGTAAANYYPAVVEAYHARVPLLVLTADRPHELRDIGAPQAMNQLQLYGNFAKEFIELALPEATEKMFHYVRMTVARALVSATHTPAGPVHINVPLREPLLPNLLLENLWEHGRLNGDAHRRVVKGETSLQQIDEFVDLFSIYEKGVIICGEGVENSKDEIISFAEATGYPIIADPLSGLRSGTHKKEFVIDCYDTFLRGEQTALSLQPDVIVRFGAMPVSKAMYQWLNMQAQARSLVVEEGSSWRDYTLLTSEKIICHEKSFCEEISRKITKRAKTSWLEEWRSMNNWTKEKLAKANNHEGFFEGKVVQEIQKLLPESSIFFVGNSMPIRDVDTFFTTDEKNVRIFANRGVNGIDGVVSTALGTSITGEPLLLLIGDLSFFHDMNGLLSAKLHDINVTIVLVNNDGGGIFSFLPQRKEEKHFESLFGTPLSLDYEYAVKMYGGTFHRVTDWNDFGEKVTNSFAEKGLKVIEVVTDREENRVLHQEIWNAVKTWK